MTEQNQNPRRESRGMETSVSPDRVTISQRGTARRRKQQKKNTKQTAMMILRRSLLVFFTIVLVLVIGL